MHTMESLLKVIKNKIHILLHLKNKANPYTTNLCQESLHDKPLSGVN